MRAYVLIDGVSIGNVINPNPITGNPPIIPTDARIAYPFNGPLVRLVIKNFGKTPAHSVISWADIVVREHPLFGALPPKQKTPFITKSLIGSGGATTKNVVHAKPPTPQQMDDLRAGTHAIYVYGDIAYTDTFKSTQTTNFRFMYRTFTGAIGITTDMTYMRKRQ